MKEMMMAVPSPIPVHKCHPRVSASTSPTFRIASSTSSTSSLAQWTATEIAEAVSGMVVKWGPPGTVSADTRTLRPGQWFFAI